VSKLIDKKVDRRTTLKWMSLAAGAVAVSGSGLLSQPDEKQEALNLKPPLSPEVQTRHEKIVEDLKAKHSADTVYVSRCYCESCLMNVHVKDGVITAIQPKSDTFFPGVAREDEVMSDMDLIKHRVNMRGCARGYSDNYDMSDASTLRYPVRRVPGSLRGEQKFYRITWDEALTAVADKIIECKARYGPASILGTFGTYSNTSDYARMMSFIEAGVGGWGYSTWDAQRFAQQMMTGWLGYGTAAPTGNDADWLMNTKLMVMYGWTPTTTHHNCMNSQYYLILLRERGTPIIVIDPRYTPEAEVFADQYIPIKPGTGAAFWLAVAYVLIRDDLYDKDYVDKYTYGFDRFKTYVIGHQDGVPKTPGWSEKICAIPAETIEDFAQLYADSKPTYLKLHFGAIRRHQAENEARLGIVLQAMMGYIGVPGGCLPLNFPTGVWDMPSASPPSGKDRHNPDYPFPCMYRIHNWAQAVNLLPEVKKWRMGKKEYDILVGNASPEMGVPNYKMAFGHRNAVVTGTSGSNPCVEALGRLDFVVHLQRQMTPTAKLSDVVLPMSYYWQSSSIAGESSGFNARLLQQKVCEPPGEPKPQEWIYTKLAQKLGVLDRYNYWYTTDEEWDDTEMDRTQMGYERFEASMRDEGYDVPTWEGFKKEGVVVHDEYARDEPWCYPWKDIIEAGQLPTETGKIEIYNEYVAKTDPMEPLFGGANEMTVIGRPVPPIPIYQPCARGIDSPLVKNWPITLLSSHSRYRRHSSGYGNPMLTGEVYRHRVWMSVADAKARGIEDNDLVRVWNDEGEAIIPAYVTSRMSPGVALIRFGAWYDPNKQGIDMVGSSNTFNKQMDGSPHWPAMVQGLVEIEPLYGTGFRGEV
jgi:anaerobic dimethyl sulfoxide reductase subunit A